MKNICIYCGSSTGTNPEYVEAARRLGTILAVEVWAWSTAAAGSA